MNRSAIFSTLSYDAKSGLGVALEFEKPGGPAYFISDLHLGAYPRTEQESVPRLLDLLAHVEEEKGDLYIAGDLLDFWFEYRTVVPRLPFRLLSRLKALVDSGCRVSYIAGNHDYWMGDFLTRQVGLETYPDSLEATIGGRRFFISHGDSISGVADPGYRMLKGFLRSRPVVGAFRLLHPDLGIGLAQMVSRLSRRRSENNHNQPDLSPFIKNRAARGFDYVVLGHLHKPLIFGVGRTRCLIIGDWIDHFSYGLFENGELRLMRWSASGAPEELKESSRP
jgi:UDP-2,3-diacylglucosamine hydrolase